MPVDFNEKIAVWNQQMVEMFDADDFESIDSLLLEIASIYNDSVTNADESVDCLLAYRDFIETWLSKLQDKKNVLKERIISSVKSNKAIKHYKST